MSGRRIAPTNDYEFRCVPDPPDYYRPDADGNTDILWIDVLRWIIVVADLDSSEMTWACRLIGSAHGGGLKGKQIEVADEIYRKVRELWDDGLLSCQIAHKAVLQDEVDIAAWHDQKKAASTPISDPNILPFRTIEKEGA